MKFRKDWEKIESFTYEEIVNRVTNIFAKWEKSNLKITYGRRERTISDTYGLPYTSSSGCAMLSNTNVEAVLIKEPEYKFDYLAINDNREIVALLTKANETEKYIVIGTL